MEWTAACSSRKPLRRAEPLADDLLYGQGVKIPLTAPPGDFLKGGVPAAARAVPGNLLIELEPLDTPVFSRGNPRAADGADEVKAGPVIERAGQPVALTDRLLGD